MCTFHIVGLRLLITLGRLQLKFEMYFSKVYLNKLISTKVYFQQQILKNCTFHIVGLRLLITLGRLRLKSDLYRDAVTTKLPHHSHSSELQ